MAAQSDRGVLYSTLCPKFLHTNSTSHTSPFSAIAELIDNAYDPDVNANQFWIDKIMVKGQECLSFMDNGNGLVHETMHKMLSFGYSDKTPINGVAPIGIYGNGFKSGSMRLGKDAIVFSKSESTSCVGMLSQTYLAEIGANQIVVPIVCFEHTESRKLSVKEEHKVSLEDILRYSPFKTEEELLTELGHIGPSWSTEKTGTRIIIWSLRKTSTEKLEYDFVKDRYDIRVPSDIYEVKSDTSPGVVSSYIPESVYSLRAYCRILYLKPRMQIIIRGQKVQTKLIIKSLALCRKDHYKPSFWPRRVPIHFGYNTVSKDQYGIMMYHKNRLIKAYERVGCQIKANRQGVGVIGVIECNFLDPTHNKQSFNESDKHRNTMNSLGVKLEEYWKEIQYRSNKDNANSNTPVEDTKKRPDQNWVQCDTCLKWRKLPDGIDCSKLPDRWFCHMNPDPQFRSCQVEAELEDSDDDQPSYCKTYKQQERQNKMQQEKKRQKEEDAQQHQQIQRLLKQQEQLKQQLRQTTATPITPRHRINIKSPQGGAVKASSSPLSSSTIAQAACSPSSSSGLPVISDVRSLSSCSPSMKRTHPVTPQETPKRLRVNGFSRGISEVSSSVNLSPLCSPSVPVEEDDTDDTDDDIFILETGSTTKPKKLCFTATTVKKEPIDANVCMVLECSDDADVDITSEKTAAGTSSTGCDAVDHPALVLTSITTQTEAPKMKKEVEDQSQTKENVSAEVSRVDIGVCTTDQRVIKQESVKGTVKCEPSGHHEEHVLQNGVTHHLESDEAAGPSCADARERKYPPPHLPNTTEAHKQQSELEELMQKTAEERDCLKEKLNQLTCQLQEMQSRVPELSQTNVKKECSHQACQTVTDTEEGQDYKSLFLKAKDKVDQLINDKEALLANADAMRSRDQAEKNEADEIALQVDNLMRELDQKNKEKEELSSQLDSVKEERANLSTQCEELRLSLQQLRDEAASSAVSSSNSRSDTFRSLIELRQNVGRLLVTFVPALDPGQVNFECNVIDEILEQVLSDDDFLRKVGQIQ